jgi:hypothetical protein
MPSGPGYVLPPASKTYAVDDKTLIDDDYSASDSDFSMDVEPGTTHVWLTQGTAQVPTCVMPFNGPVSRLLVG